MFSLIPVVLCGIVLMIAGYLWIGTKIEALFSFDAAYYLILITAIVFFLYPVVPALNILCGILGIVFCKKEKAAFPETETIKIWRRLSVFDILLGAVTAYPSLLLYSAALSERM